MANGEAKDLMITILDNDFTSNYDIIGKAIMQSLRSYCIDDQDVINVDDAHLETIKQYVARIWWSIDNLVRVSENVMRGSEYPAIDYSNYIDSLKIGVVEYKDIPEFENSSRIYIPLFDGGDIILN